MTLCAPMPVPARAHKGRLQRLRTRVQQLVPLWERRECLRLRDPRPYARQSYLWFNDASMTQASALAPGQATCPTIPSAQLRAAVGTARMPTTARPRPAIRATILPGLMTHGAMTQVSALARCQATRPTIPAAQLRAAVGTVRMPTTARDAFQQGRQEVA